MHPEIEKFWTHSGYYVETDIMMPCEHPYILFWFVMKADKQLWCIGQSNSYDRKSEAYEQLKEDPPCTIYYFNEKQYTEEEMLRIIKLKVFL